MSRGDSVCESIKRRTRNNLRRTPRRSVTRYSLSYLWAILLSYERDDMQWGIDCLVCSVRYWGTRMEWLTFKMWF